MIELLLAAGAISLAFTLFLTPLFIRVFRKLAWGQFIRDDGPQSPPREARDARRWAASSSSSARSSATSRAI